MHIILIVSYTAAHSTFYILHGTGCAYLESYSVWSITLLWCCQLALWGLTFLTSLEGSYLYCQFASHNSDINRWLLYMYIKPAYNENSIFFKEMIHFDATVLVIGFLAIPMPPIHHIRIEFVMLCGLSRGMCTDWRDMHVARIMYDRLGLSFLFLHLACLSEKCMFSLFVIRIVHNGPCYFFSLIYFR